MTLNILLCTNHLHRRGGSETYTRALSDEFARRGDFVEVFTNEPGAYSLSCGLNVVERPAARYDLILVSHNTCLPRVAACAGPKILTCHGVFPDLEQPIRGADRYVAISEEVAEHMGHLGFQAEVIRNGVDLDVFAPRSWPSERLRSVLCLAQGRAARDVVRAACLKLGVSYALAEDMSEERLAEAMNMADLVVSLGRGAYEAMACGRAVLVYDSRHYIAGAFCDGLVTPANWADLARFNLSGRANVRIAGVEEIVQALSDYRPEMGNANRGLALAHHNVALSVEAYLRLAVSA